MTYFAQIGSSKQGWFQSKTVADINSIRAWARDLITSRPDLNGSDLHIYRNGPNASDYRFHKTTATV